MPGDERAPHAPPLSEVTPDLADGELEVVGLMPNASNATFLTRVRHADQETFAIYKPARGETPLWDFPDGTLHRREVAAYEVSEGLGWHLVPATVLREGPFGPGSVQRFIRFDPDQHYFTLELTHAELFRRVALFDIVANNADRKGGHCLLGEDARVWMIDHGVCFHEEPKLRTVIWEFVGEPIRDEEIGALGNLTEGLEGEVGERLGVLLSPGEFRALRERLERLVAAGRFPEPDPTMRPYPWPPI
jgi:uncharacterized repeat protein (TIGR03843 family)